MAKLVTHPNGWHRDTLQRIIVENQEATSREQRLAIRNELRRIIRRQPSDQGSIAAIRTMSGFGQLDSSHLSTIIQREELDESVMEEGAALGCLRVSDLTREAVILAETYAADDFTLADRIVDIGTIDGAELFGGEIQIALRNSDETFADRRIRLAALHMYQPRGSSVPYKIALGLGKELPKALLESKRTWFPEELIAAATLGADARSDI